MTFRVIHSITKSLLYLLVASTLIEACAKLPISKAYWEHSYNQEPSSFTGFNNKFNLRYTIANDSTNLYVYLDTDNRMVEAAIFRDGVTIYFDPTGKKGKNCYFQYPYHSGQRSDISEMMKNRDRDGSSSDQHNRNRFRDFKSPTMAYWKKGTDGYTINTAMIHTPFKYEIKIDSLDYMNYRVSIPLTEIAAAGYKDLSDLSVGIQIKPNSNRSEGFRSGGFRGRFGGGDDGGGFGRRGEDGGYGGRGEGGERGGYGGRSGERTSHSFTPANVSIWFIAKLASPSQQSLINQ